MKFPLLAAFIFTAATQAIWATGAMPAPEAQKAAPITSRYGIAYAGHLVYKNALGIEGVWTLLDREDKFFLKNVTFTSGFAMLTTAKLFEVPVLFRAELFRLWYIGFQIAKGINLTYFRGTSSQSSPVGVVTVLCAATPITIGRLRIQPEICVLPSTTNPGNFGGSVYYAF